MFQRKWISRIFGVTALATAAPVLAAGEGNQETADAVARALRTDSGLSASRIKIESRDGVVTLSGIVPAGALKGEAVARARGVAGVSGVIDRLAVGDPRVVPAAYPGESRPTQVAMGGGLFHGRNQGSVVNGGMVDGGMVNGGIIDGGMIQGGSTGGGYVAGMDGPAPEGPAMGGGAATHSQGQPNYAWPSYAPYPNYSAVGYPTTYPWQAFPNIGPFHPYPEVPLDWRAVTLRWDDGIWWLDFKKHYTRPFFTPYPFGLFAY